MDYVSQRSQTFPLVERTSEEYCLNYYGIYRDGESGMVRYIKSGIIYLYLIEWQEYHL